MTTATLEHLTATLMLMDAGRTGSAQRDPGDYGIDFSAVLDGAFWSLMLQGELEDALDTALFRAALAETPTLSTAGMLVAF